MFNLLAVFSILFNAKELIEEKMEKPILKNTRFDYDAFCKDIDNGMSATDQIKKRKNGGYMTDDPLPSNMNFNNVVDIKRYLNDKNVYGEIAAEMWRKNGNYKYIRNL